MSQYVRAGNIPTLIMVLDSQLPVISIIRSYQGTGGACLHGEISGIHKNVSQRSIYDRERHSRHGDFLFNFLRIHHG